MSYLKTDPPTHLTASTGNGVKIRQLLEGGGHADLYETVRGAGAVRHERLLARLSARGGELQVIDAAGRSGRRGATMGWLRYSEQCEDGTVGWSCTGLCRGGALRWLGVFGSVPDAVQVLLTQPYNYPHAVDTLTSTGFEAAVHLFREEIGAERG